ncbi:hypothetical protein [Nocardia beijingensis]|uniref:hypothetical protein n=1 Tax=Nocardia beijingensis TaxID=95162 RepID=UPI0033E32B08
MNAPDRKQLVVAFVASFPPIALLAASHGVGLLVVQRPEPVHTVSVREVHTETRSTLSALGRRVVR